MIVPNLLNAFRIPIPIVDNSLLIGRSLLDSLRLYKVFSIIEIWTIQPFNICSKPKINKKADHDRKFR